MSYKQLDSPITAKLCNLLVEAEYGDLASRVFSILARHGRQTLAGIVRASYFNGRQIKLGLVVLVQQHLVFYSSTDQRVTYYEINWHQAYALVRIGKVLTLAENRFGKKASNLLSNLITLGHARIADLKEAYFPSSAEKSAADDHSDDDDDDDDAADDNPDDSRVNGVNSSNGKISDVQLNGTRGVERRKSSSSPPEDAKPILNLDNDLEASYLNGYPPTNASTTESKVPQANGAVDPTNSANDDEPENDWVQSTEELYATIYHLMRQGWIIKVDQMQYLSAGDLDAMARKEITAEEFPNRPLTGPKDKTRLEIATVQRKRRYREQWLQVPYFESQSDKRKAAGVNEKASKRLKINGTYVSRSESAHSVNSTNGTAYPEDDLVIRLNHEKVAVAMRTEQLTRLVQHRLGFSTAQVYRTLLGILEVNLARCYEEWPDPVPPPQDGIDVQVEPHFLVTARDVAEKIDPAIDLLDGLDPKAIVKHVGNSKVVEDTRLDPPINPFQISRDEKTKIVDVHMQLLQSDPFRFVIWYSRAGYSQWRVDFEKIAKATIELEIENTITARKGPLGVKLIRALKKKGKLDERQACNTMMMSAHDIRGTINDMVVQGFVQTQEIPRVDRREAKLSIHLIWYDLQRAREKLLYDTYKGMVRIMQRLAFEKEQVASLLQKAERTDVVGNEAKYLTKRELDALRKWKDVENKLLLQLYRQDELVATLGDFLGPLVTI
ncbi:DNA directed RNA polymeras-like protein III subunit Rpc82 [Lojkania enalia]|uniref:DNA-directed RNA polymerase III subunit RPC3 n=1 Tax=Lojkania enalia TaxID=147567 RepID=A0A9P4KGW1_9PLEO|nr:DNA directed RNA polymeras-like protein III subunit Rpc82 [Didymosphaeria enalia]